MVTDLRSGARAIVQRLDLARFDIGRRRERRRRFGFIATDALVAIDGNAGAVLVARVQSVDEAAEYALVKTIAGAANAPASLYVRFAQIKPLMEKSA